MLKKINNKLILVIIIGLVLRYVGITHAFPYIFHPDEATVVRSALGVRFDPNPAHFDWPHLYIYLNYFLYMLFAKFRDFTVAFGFQTRLQEIFPLMWNDSLIFYLITRVLGATLGALTAIPIFLAGKNIFNERTGLLAALLLAVTPFHVWHSHYSLTDVPMAFFSAWVLYFSSMILFKNELKYYLLAGLFVGLSATTKYNGALTAIFIVIAHFFRVLSEKHEKIFSVESISKLLLGGVMSGVGFLLGTPFSLLDSKTFLRTDGPQGALWQFTNIGSVSLIEQISNFFGLFAGKFLGNFGYTTIFLFVLCVIFVFSQLLARKAFVRKDLLFLVISSIILIFYVAGAEKLRAHYFFMVYPPLILAASGFLSEMVLNRPRIVGYFLWIVTLIVPFSMSAIDSYAFAQDDTRIQLVEWLKKNYSGVQTYYIGGELSPVMEDYAQRVGDSETQMPPGALLVTADLKRSEYELLKNFDTKLRRGPVVNIYRVK